MINKFEDTIKQMIRLHRTRMDNFAEKHSLYTPVEFAKEHGTFQIDPGRQTGKTEFILKNLKNNHYAFFHNSATLKYFEKRLCDLHKPKFGYWAMPGDVLHCFSSLGKLLPSRDLEKTKTTIWVDESKFLTQDQKKNLYALARKDYTTQFIFLG